MFNEFTFDGSTLETFVKYLFVFALVLCNGFIPSDELVLEPFDESMLELLDESILEIFDECIWAGPFEVIFVDATSVMEYPNKSLLGELSDEAFINGGVLDSPKSFRFGEANKEESTILDEVSIVDVEV